MASTSRADFHANTEALEVAKEYASAIKGKTVLVTGVNLSGIGFTTAQAIVRELNPTLHVMYLPQVGI
jgi:hypothetical protein